MVGIPHLAGDDGPDLARRRSSRINDPKAAGLFFLDPMASGLKRAVPYQQDYPGALAVSRTSSTAKPILPAPQPNQARSPTACPASTQPNVFFDLTSAPVFEDDLIAVNVRSVNIKGFDPNPRYFDATLNRVVSLLPGYYDLGYASGLNANHAVQTPPYMLDTLGHEGRMPPLTADNRVDAQNPVYDIAANVGSGTTVTPVPASLGDNNTSLIRMRRTWDSWSTTYTNAPSTPLNPSLPYPFCGPQGGFVPGDTSVPPVIARGRSIVRRIPPPIRCRCGGSRSRSASTTPRDGTSRP